MAGNSEDSEGMMKQSHWTAEEYREYLRTGREPVQGKVVPIRQAGDNEIRKAEKRRKYGNEPVYLDGKRFDSKHEAMVYKDLLLRVKAGELKCVLRQVKFDLTDTEQLQYVADFVTISPDMRIEVMDAKSEATRKNKVYVIKKKLMREKWGIEIREV